jgi:hypothetical protein
MKVEDIHQAMAGFLIALGSNLRKKLGQAGSHRWGKRYGAALVALKNSQLTTVIGMPNGKFDHLALIGRNISRRTSRIDGWRAHIK